MSERIRGGREIPSKLDDGSTHQPRVIDTIQRLKDSAIFLVPVIAVCALLLPKRTRCPSCRSMFKARSRGVKIGARDKDLQTRTDFTNDRSRDRRAISGRENIRAQFHSPYFSVHERAYSSSKFLSTGYTGCKDCCSVVHLGHSDFVNKFRMSKQRLATSDPHPPAETCPLIRLLLPLRTRERITEDGVQLW